MANMLSTIKQGLTDLKRTKEETKPTPEINCCSSQDEYPYGLCIDLNTDSLDKLGISIDKYNVKDVVNIVAECQVKSLSQSSYSSGKDNKNLSLQITKMKIQEDKKGK
jgi:Major coat protein-like